jgi:protein O-GlcNAc transferase
MASHSDHQRLQEAYGLHQSGRLAEAAELYRKLIKRDSRNSNALHFLGLIEAGLGNIDQAKSLLARSVAVQPKNISFLQNYATILFQAGDYANALKAAAQGLQVDGNDPSLLYVAAVALFKLGQLDDSIAGFDRLLARVPNHIDAINERGTVYAAMKRFDLALESCDRALALDRQNAEALANRGNVFYELRRLDEALAAFDEALARKSGLAEAWAGRGNVLRAFKRPADAIAAYEQAVALKPALAPAWLGLGNVLYDVRDYAAALAAYDRAFALEPNLNFVASNRLHTRQFLCDWSSYPADVSFLQDAIHTRQVLATPFFNLSLPIAPADQLANARRYVAGQPALAARPRDPAHDHDRIRIAYVSSDLRDHPVGRQIAEVIEQHDKARFDITAISLASETTPSGIGTRLKAAFEHFVDAQTWDEQRIATYIRDSGTDIAIDLNGFTEGGRLGIFARRAAPLQVNYLGYAGTLGADFYDYILADRAVIPEDHFKDYGEKVVWLPDSFMATESRRAISDTTPGRAAFGLPDRGFVFCSFNAPYKLSPEIFAVWMRLLNKVAGSVLWLLQPNEIAKANLQRTAEQAGIASERLVFAARVESHADHLARQRLADLFLDSLPYNAHVTAIEALWAGLPILTCLGDTFAGRVAASMLTAVGLPELITPNLERYEAAALELATHPDRLAAIRKSLAERRLQSSLFDSKRVTRHIEAAYVEMMTRHQAGQAPDHFAVPRQF